MDDENELCRYGTPLDPIEEDQMPSKKPITKEDQIAVDENGRRRFHGAFTGGFSAGFWNTVGSLEGWKPQAFKSSRREKAGRIVQSIEDFMDNEDTGEFGIAPKRIQTHEDFTASGSGQKRSFGTNVEGVLQKMLAPSRDNIGTRLLRKMGWREGQGVGVRLTRRAKRQADRQQRKEQQLARRYGCDLGPLNQSSSESSSGESDSEVTFAPGDFDTFIVTPKVNVFGLGYTGLERTPVLQKLKSGTDTFAVMGKNNRKMMISGKAFGVGAFEDEDEDIYTRDDMTQYDFSLEDQKKPKTARSGNERSQLGVLEGFIAARDSVSGKYLSKIFRIELPRDFQARNFLVRKSRFAPLPPQVERQIREKSDKHSLSDRKPEVKETPSMPQSSQKQKLFSYDSAKQERFNKFLEISEASSEESIKEFFQANQPLHLSQFDRQTEQREFLQARKMHKHLAGMMSNRFVAEGSAETTEKSKEKSPEPVKTEGPEERTFYSRRVKTTWKPDSLLCKRFNVPEPFGGVLEEKPKNRKRSNVFECLKDPINQRIDFTASKVPEIPKESPPMITPKPKEILPVRVETPNPPQAPQVERLEVKELPEVPPPINRPKNELEEAVLEAKDKHPADKKDLFKSIFEDSEEEEEKEEVPEKAPQPDVNPLRNPAEPQGIFSKIFFVRKAAEKKKEEQKIVQEVKETVQEAEKEEESGIFGPRLPPMTSVAPRKSAVDFFGRPEKRKREKWVEKEELVRKKRKKEKQKKEKKHKKSKKKHKSKD